MSAPVSSPQEWVRLTSEMKLTAMKIAWRCWMDAVAGRARRAAEHNESLRSASRTPDGIELPSEKLNRDQSQDDRRRNVVPRLPEPAEKEARTDQPGRNDE